MSPNLFDVEGKKVVISGGARGIGGAVARTLVENGAHVAILDVLDQQGQAHTATLNTTGPGKAFYFHADISKRDEAFDAFKRAVDALGGIDALHNIAGVERSTPLEDITEADFDLVFDVNVKGTLWLTQAAFPHLKAGGGGTIVNIGSDSALMPFPQAPHYSASKGAIHSLTRSMAAEGAPYGIRVNTAIPAAKTDMYYQIEAKKTDEERAESHEWMKRTIILGGDLGTVDEFTPIMIYLTSDASIYATGQMFSVNGGMTFSR